MEVDQVEIITKHINLVPRISSLENEVERKTSREYVFVSDVFGGVAAVAA